MTPIVLTAHQTEAVEFLADHLQDGDPIVALRGLAGTGKTSLIPALIDVLEGIGIPVTLGAPTHRAAMVLKKKGLLQADTVHAHALVPYFSGDYTRALRWLGGSCQCRTEDLANAQPAMDGVPWLVAERLKVTGHPPEVVKARARQHDPKKALESIGITGRLHFAGFGAKEGEGVLLIDEASMVGADMLKLCQEAFPQICLVGDPGQLPPVKDTGTLAHVPGFELTEVHRQAADSPIVQLAYAARKGAHFWEGMPHVPGALEEWLSVEASQFLTAPLVVWRNKTRLECTAAIRKELGFPPDRLALGEPLVCRSTDPRARADGMYNNAIFRVVSPSIVVQQHDNPMLTTIQPDGNPDAETLDVLIHMEELHGDNIDPEAVLFRFGYCLTAHTAQGGEWHTVYISKPDLFAHSKRTPLEGEEDDFKRWAYTAITRAKATLGFIRTHDFGASAVARPIPWILPPIGDEMPRMKQETKIAPPSAPMLNMDPHEPDDIPDPAVPEGTADEVMDADIPGLPAPAGPEPVDVRITSDVGVPQVAAVPAQIPLEAPRMPQDASNVSAPMPTPAAPQTSSWAEHEALLAGFCGALQKQMSEKLDDEARRLAREVDRTITRMCDYVKGRLESTEHAESQLSAALAQTHDKGLTIHGSPYEMTLQVYSPAGIPLSLTIRKATPEALLNELTRLETWFAMHDYTGDKPAQVEA